MPRGGPDGGDGGDGGSVVLIADPAKHSFLDLRYRRHERAAPGAAGGPKNRHGRRGSDLLIPVPLGTLVRDEGGALLADLTAAGQRARVAAGGSGGRGNRRFTSSRHQTPRHAEKGLPGEQRKIFLELKLLAQVGLVGFPNAGKSTLLSRITAARPRVADFPFTTLQPQLGLAETGGGSFVVADLPGLIEGAHRGAGLGHRFLRHVERNLLLLLVIDLSPEAQPDPVEAYRQLLAELELYSKKLAGFPRVVAGNKRDLPGTRENLDRLQRLVGQEKGTPVKVFGVSAATGAGIEELLQHLAAEVVRQSSLPAAEPEERIIKVEPEKEEAPFAIEKEEGAYRVRGHRIERITAQTDFENDESLRRFQHYCRRCGLERALKRMGVKEGDTVCIGEEEFYYGE